MLYRCIKHIQLDMLLIKVKHFLLLLFLFSCNNQQDTVSICSGKYSKLYHKVCKQNQYCIDMNSCQEQTIIVKKDFAIAHGKYACHLCF